MAARKTSAKAADADTTTNSSDTTELPADSTVVPSDPVIPLDGDQDAAVAATMKAETAEIEGALNESLTAASELGESTETTSNSRRRDAEAHARPARKRLTKKEAMDLRNRYREHGLKLLDTKAVGVPFLAEQVTIRHRAVADLFVQTYGALDNAVSVFQRFGQGFLGAKNASIAQQRLGELVSEVEQSVIYCARETQVAIAQNNQSSSGADLDAIKLQYNAPLDRQCISRSSHASRVLKAIRGADEALADCDKLVWAGMITQNEVDKHFLSIRANLGRLVVFCVRTLGAINQERTRRYRAMSEEIANTGAVADPVAA